MQRVSVRMLSFQMEATTATQSLGIKKHQIH